MFIGTIGTVGRVAGVASNLWTPAQLGTALEGWWDAADTSTMTMDGSNRVSAWTDKSSKGRTATQSTLASRPVYNATARNSAPGLTFDGSDDSLAFSDANLPAGSSASTQFHVGYNVVGNSGTTSSYGTLSDGQSRTIQGIAGTWGLVAINNTSRSDIASDGVDRILSVEMADGGSTLFTADGGSSTYSGSLAEPPNTFRNAGRIGARIDSAVYYSGAIQAIVIVNRTLISDERAKLHGWAAWRFNLVSKLPAGHPYKSAAPTV